MSRPSHTTVLFSVCLCLSSCLSMSAWLSTCLPACLSGCPPACLSSCPPACLSGCLTACVSHLFHVPSILFPGSVFGQTTPSMAFGFGQSSTTGGSSVFGQSSAFGQQPSRYECSLVLLFKGSTSMMYHISQVHRKCYHLT